MLNTAVSLQYLRKRLRQFITVFGKTINLDKYTTPSELGVTCFLNSTIHPYSIPEPVLSERSIC